MAPPLLRGMVQRKLQKDIFQAIGMGIVFGCVWKFGYADPKKRQYEAFYKNYDAEKVAIELEAMQEAA